MPPKLHYGLIGQRLDYSWSQAFFEDKFKSLAVNADYQNLEFTSKEEIRKETLLNYDGLNVTVPYKEAIIALLDELSEAAAEIGAVNCIVNQQGKLVGHNTDAYAFRDSLKPFLKSWHSQALILGTGGASKAVAYVLDKLGIDYRFVSREPSAGQYSYEDIVPKALELFPFVINCTPLGMYPAIDTCPQLPYEALGPKNLLYDLNYNPEQTKYLAKGAAAGSQTINGKHMLIAQAEASWKLWNPA